VLLVPLLLLAALDDLHRERRRRGRSDRPTKTPEEVAKETAFWARRLS
jgi:hypothetical protein